MVADMLVDYLNQKLVVSFNMRIQKKDITRIDLLGDACNETSLRLKFIHKLHEKAIKIKGKTFFLLDNATIKG